MRNVYLSSIAYYVPPGKLNNEQLEARFPDWPAAKIEEKLGICHRGVSDAGQYASDLGVLAAQALLTSGPCLPGDIDFLLVCTQTPDYLAPTTACLIQHRLGLRKAIAAVDINLGCSGYVYGICLAKALIESGQSEKLLFITTDTYTKFIRPDDKSLLTLFGDGATATLLACEENNSKPYIGPFVFETDGGGGLNLMISGAAAKGIGAGQPALYMNGPEIFNFTIRTIPKILDSLLASAALGLKDIDLFVFHQANAYMLEHLRKKLAIPIEKFVVSMKDTGNTVSSTIPIALKECLASQRLSAGMTLVLLGFGVGYSTIGTIVRWK